MRTLSGGSTCLGRRRWMVRPAASSARSSSAIWAPPSTSGRRPIPSAIDRRLRLMAIAAPGSSPPSPTASSWRSVDGPPHRLLCRCRHRLRDPHPCHRTGPALVPALLAIVDVVLAVASWADLRTRTRGRPDRPRTVAAVPATCRPVRSSRLTSTRSAATDGVFLAPSESDAVRCRGGDHARLTAHLPDGRSRQVRSSCVRAARIDSLWVLVSGRLAFGAKASSSTKSASRAAHRRDLVAPRHSPHRDRRRGRAERAAPRRRRPALLPAIRPSPCTSPLGSPSGCRSSPSMSPTYPPVRARPRDLDGVRGLQSVPTVRSASTAVWALDAIRIPTRGLTSEERRGGVVVAVR